MKFLDNSKSLKQLCYILILVILPLFVLTCSDDDDGQEMQEPVQLRFGAIYIGCETPPWQFNFTGILSCEQQEQANLDLNLEHACSMFDIQLETGEVSVSFSDNLSLGRIKVESTQDVILQDSEANQVSSLYVNDEDLWYLTKNGVTLQLDIVNVYVGGCFHELIRWEEQE